MRQLAIIGAGTAGGDPAKQLFRRFESILKDHGNGPEPEREPSSSTPLSQADFERMLKEQ